MNTTPVAAAAAAVVTGLDIDTVVDLISARIEILHPTTGQPTGAWLELAGPEHPMRRQRMFDRSRAMRAELQRRGGRIEMTDPEEDEASKFEDVVAYTIGWGGFSQAGQVMECTDANKRAVLSRTWLKRQAIVALEDATNFIGSSSAS